MNSRFDNMKNWASSIKKNVVRNISLPPSELSRRTMGYIKISFFINILIFFFIYDSLVNTSSVGGTSISDKVFILFYFILIFFDLFYKICIFY